MSTFTDIIGHLEGGHTFEDLNDRLRELAQAVTEHGKPGTLSLTLTVSPNGRHNYTVVPEVKVKLPQAARMKTIFFGDEYGNLLRRDPRQKQLPFKDVEEAALRELREAR